MWMRNHGIPVEERITAILARIHDDNRPTIGCALEIGEERREEEM